MDNILVEVTNLCLKHFGLKESDLYSYTRKGDKVLARHLLWYVLHVDYNISTGVLSKEFLRTRRQIFNAINKIKNGIRKQRFYKELYDNFALTLKNI